MAHILQLIDDLIALLDSLEAEPSTDSESFDFLRHNEKADSLLRIFLRRALYSETGYFLGDRSADMELINSLKEMINTIDFGYEIDEIFLSGSASRKTDIRMCYHTWPVSDLDFMVVFKDENIFPNPQLARESIAKSIEEQMVPILKKDKPMFEKRVEQGTYCVHLFEYPICSISWNIDIVPAVRSGNNFQIYDADDNRWITTNPSSMKDLSKARMEAVPELELIIAGLKYWNTVNADIMFDEDTGYTVDNKLFKSIHLELLLLQCTFSDDASLSLLLIEAFRYLSKNFDETIFAPCGDFPVSSYVSQDPERRTRIQEAISAGLKLSQRAMNFDMDGNLELACTTWCELFQIKHDKFAKMNSFENPLIQGFFMTY